jgi:hypothetical protein
LLALPGASELAACRNGPPETVFFLGAPRRPGESPDMATLLLLAPLFLVFEGWQLVMGERYLGIRQIARNGDPRELGLGELTAFCWSITLFAYWLWMIGLLAVPLPFARLHSVLLLGVSAIGYGLRRNTGIKWVLVILTFEGAVRIPLLVSLLAMAWRRL